MYHYKMNRIELKTKLLESKLFNGDSTINSLLSGRRYPSFSKALKLEKEFQIPMEAWKDIKSYVNESITACNDTSKIENNNKTIKENV